MKITLNYTYTEDVIPKHCRKARPMPFEGQIDLTIHETTGGQAPVAIRQHDWNWDTHDRSLVTEYRWWNERLWKLCRFQRYAHAPWETQTAAQFGADSWPYYKQTYKPYSVSDHQREVRRHLMHFAHSVLIIDGMRWEETEEPRYVITTHGLGHNHGGTSLWTCNYYNSNISNTRYFRADQADKAVEAAVAIALRRGDNKSVDDIREERNAFEVLIPEAIRLNPAKEHGKGDPFMNRLEGIIDSSPDTLVAGLLVISETAKTIEEVKAGAR